MEKDIFSKCIFDYNKLLDYGFIKDNNKYKYSTNIMNNKFRIDIIISNNIVNSKVIDLEFNEEYISIKIDSFIGEYVSKVREEYNNILYDIKNKCCIINYFKYEQSNRVSKYIDNKYNIKPEFLFKDDDNTGVFRNNKKKWFGIIMNINKLKLDNENKDIEVINIKLDPDRIISLLEEEGFYKAYHMNKKYWISIILDNSVNDKLLFNLIDESYDIVYK